MKLNKPNLALLLNLKCTYAWWTSLLTTTLMQRHTRKGVKQQSGMHHSHKINNSACMTCRSSCMLTRYCCTTGWLSVRVWTEAATGGLLLSSPAFGCSNMYSTCHSNPSRELKIRRVHNHHATYDSPAPSCNPDLAGACESFALNQTSFQIICRSITDSIQNDKWAELPNIHHVAPIE